MLTAPENGALPRSRWASRSWNARRRALGSGAANATHVAPLLLPGAAAALLAGGGSTGSEEGERGEPGALVAALYGCDGARRGARDGDADRGARGGRGRAVRNRLASEVVVHRHRLRSRRRILLLLRAARLRRPPAQAREENSHNGRCKRQSTNPRL